jgi:pimeloyl-ACP methyl ester carboxylesterase
MSSSSFEHGPLEYQLFGDSEPGAVTLVMLHEGLGSLAMWRDFPQTLADSLRLRVLAYSRYGYGQSAPLSAPRAVSYMHDEALIVLPQLLQRLGIERPLLFGHSDGASIALIHASRNPVRGVIALAPHVFVEDLSVKSIAAARVAYETTDLRSRLARYHADVDSAFWGWNDIWLHPDFRGWNIEALLPQIQSPVLVIQGQEDEYGTEAQLHAIARGARDVQLSLLPDCGHSPQRARPEKVLEAIRGWVSRSVATPMCDCSPASDGLRSI